MAIERWRPFGLAERWEPFRNLTEIQGEMNRLFDDFFGRSVGTATQGVQSWAPLVDMHETKDDLVLTVDLPGVQEQDVAVSITGDLLSVKGERRFERDPKDESYLHVERAYGKFERTVRIPMPVQADKVRATYGDGVLEVRLPKAEEVKPREIKIGIQ